MYSTWYWGTVVGICFIGTLVGKVCNSVIIQHFLSKVSCDFIAKINILFNDTLKTWNFLPICLYIYTPHVMSHFMTKVNKRIVRCFKNIKMASTFYKTLRDAGSSS